MKQQDLIHLFTSGKGTSQVLSKKTWPKEAPDLPPIAEPKEYDGTKFCVEHQQHLIPPCVECCMTEERASHSHFFCQTNKKTLALICFSRDTSKQTKDKRYQNMLKRSVLAIKARPWKDKVCDFQLENTVSSA